MKDKTFLSISQNNTSNAWYLEAYDNEYVIQIHSSGPRNRVFPYPRTKNKNHIYKHRMIQYIISASPILLIFCSIATFLLS